MTFCSKCGAKLPEDAWFCHVCGAPVAGAATVPPEVHEVYSVRGTPRIVVRTWLGSGSVVVKGGAKGEVTVDLKFTNPGELGYDLAQNGQEILVRCWPKTHPAISWLYHLGGTLPRADIAIVTPAESDLDIDSTLSAVDVSGLKGSLVTESAVSTIHLKGCEGRLSVRSRTGSVEIDDFKGGVTAKSNVGSISFTGSIAEEGENLFRTNVGSIQLALRGKHNLSVELLTNIGTLLCTPELADARRDYGRYLGRIGAGTGRLIAQTNAGSITLTH